MSTTLRMGALVLFSMLAVAGIAYCHGRSAGAKTEKLTDNRRAINVARVVQDSAHQVTAVAAKKRTAAKSHVTISDDTTIVVNNVPLKLPAEQAAPVVSLLRDDEEAFAAQGTELAAVTASLVLFQQRVELLEPGRCGPKCWAAIGATAVVVVIAFATWVLSAIGR